MFIHTSFAPPISDSVCVTEWVCVCVLVGNSVLSGQWCVLAYHQKGAGYLTDLCSLHVKSYMFLSPPSLHSLIIISLFSLYVFNDSVTHLSNPLIIILPPFNYISPLFPLLLPSEVLLPSNLGFPCTDTPPPSSSPISMCRFFKYQAPLIWLEAMCVFV